MPHNTRTGSAGSARFRNRSELPEPVPRFHTVRWEPEPTAGSSPETGSMKGATNIPAARLDALRTDRVSVIVNHGIPSRYGVNTGHNAFVLGSSLRGVTHGSRRAANSRRVGSALAAGAAAGAGGPGYCFGLGPPAIRRRAPIPARRRRPGASRLRCAGRSGPHPAAGGSAQASRPPRRPVSACRKRGSQSDPRFLGPMASRSPLRARHSSRSGAGAGGSFERKPTDTTPILQGVRAHE